MSVEHCPHCGAELSSTSDTCARCGTEVDAGLRLSPHELQELQNSAPLDVELAPSKPRPPMSRASAFGGIVVPLCLLAVMLLRGPASTLLEVPWVAPTLAGVILAIGLPLALRSRRPRVYSVGIFIPVFALLCVWPAAAFIVPWLPSVLPIAVIVLVLFVLPDAYSFHDPDQFRTGVYLIAGAVITFWPVQVWIAGLELGYRAYNFALHVVSMLLSTGLFLGGLFFVSTANDFGQADSEVPHCPECRSAKVHSTLRSINGICYCCDNCDHLWMVSPARGGEG